MTQNHNHDTRPENDATEAVDRMADTARDVGKDAVYTAQDAAGTAKRKANQMGNAASDTMNEMQGMADDAMDEGKSRMGAMKDKAVEAKDAVMAGAGSTMSAVRDAAVEKADTARETLSEVGDRLAETLKRATENEDSDGLKSRVLTSVAQGITSASDVLRQRSVVDLTEDMKVLAKRHPGAFMAAAAVVGFAAARFVRSSAKRRIADRDDYRGPMA